MKTRFLFSCGVLRVEHFRFRGGYDHPSVRQILLRRAKSALHSQMALPVSSMYPEYTILRSTNLVNWEPVAGPIAGSVGVSDEFLRQAVPLAGDRAFYRVVAEVKLASA